MEKEEKIFLGYIDDKAEQCLTQDRIVNTGFLDLKQQSLVKNYCKNTKSVYCDFYGGYANAERRLAVFTPLYWDSQSLGCFDDESGESPLILLRATSQKRSPNLGHRDYLGSLLGLGLKREMIGDILIDNDSSDIIALKEIRDFLLLNYNKAGRTEISLNEISFNDIKDTDANTIENKVSVASLRLDNIVSAAFNISRKVAFESIKSGIVFVNHVEATKPDAPVREGDKLVLRGKGKSSVISVGGRSKKDKIYVTIRLWI